MLMAVLMSLEDSLPVYIIVDNERNRNTFLVHSSRAVFISISDLGIIQFVYKMKQESDTDIQTNFYAG